MLKRNEGRGAVSQGMKDMYSLEVCKDLHVEFEWQSRTQPAKRQMHSEGARWGRNYMTWSRISPIRFFPRSEIFWTERSEERFQQRISSHKKVSSGRYKQFGYNDGMSLPIEDMIGVGTQVSTSSIVRSLPKGTSILCASQMASKHHHLGIFVPWSTL